MLLLLSSSASLSNLGLVQGSSSEACLALAHSHDFIGYIGIQPRCLEQHYWVSAKISKLFYVAHSDDTPRESLRLKLLHSDYANDWLLVTSSRQLGTLLSNMELRYLLCFRLGLTISATTSQCNCCHKTLLSVADRSSDHTLCCVKAGYVRRHYLICDDIRYVLTYAGLRNSSEVYVDQHRSLQVDLVMDNFEDGKSLCLDVQILDFSPFWTSLHHTLDAWGKTR